MIRVFIAEDHAIMREGLRQIIATNPDIEIAGEAPDGAETIEALTRIKCDLLLMDMTMPHIGGVDLIRRVRAMFPALPILVLSMHDSSQIVIAAIKAGANGYITKNADPSLLFSIIKNVAVGKKYIEPQLATKTLISGNFEHQPHEVLTPREYQIMQLIINGQSTTEISRELFLSPKTVSSHKKNILLKMELPNTAELIRYALEHHLCASSLETNRSRI